MIELPRALELELVLVPKKVLPPVQNIDDQKMALTFARPKNMTDLSEETIRYFASKVKLPAKVTLDTALETVERFRGAWQMHKDDLPMHKDVISAIEKHILSPAEVSQDNMEPNMNIEKSYDMPFPKDVVYAAWVSSDTVIPPATEMDIDPVIGGHYRLIMKSPDFTSSNTGKFLAVESGRHVKYTWEWNNDAEVTEIDVTFIAIDTGTQISIIHSGFSTVQSMDAHNSGWDSYISGFIAFLKKKK